MQEERYGDIWICTDCMRQHETPDMVTDEDREQNPHTLDRIDDEFTITNNFDSDTGDGIDPFRGSRCDGCGSTLGGSRYRYALWGPRETDNE